MNVLEVKNLNVKIDNDSIIQDVSFNVEQGEVLAIIGPNGAGKTTLFKALLGLLPYNGEIHWAPNMRIGYAPQRLEVEKHIPLTVEEFLKLQPKTITNQKIDEILKFIQLDKKILKMGLGEVSLGQRQRLLIGWTLLGDPDILLFDEPTANVDIYGQESIYKVLAHLQEKLKITVILISHELNVIYQYASKVMCLNHQNICMGKPEEILNDETLHNLYGEPKKFYRHEHQ